MIVVHITPISAVGQQGAIHVGDLVVKVNGHSLVCLTEKKVAAILKCGCVNGTRVEWWA